MPRHYYLILIYIVCNISASGQDTINLPDADTLYIRDTVIETKTIRKIVYVYGPPKTHTNIGVNLSSALQFYNKEAGDNVGGFGLGTEIYVQHCKKKLLYQAGISYAYINRNIDINYQTAIGIPRSVTEIDTISWRLQIINGQEIYEYITETSYYTTIDSSYTDSIVRYSNNFHLLALPLNLGYQLFYGYLTIYGKIGITPGLLLDSKKNNYVISESKGIEYSNNAFNTFLLDLNAELSFAYLINLNTQVTFDVFYNYPLISMTKNDQYIPLKKNNLGIKIGVSYIFPTQ